MDNSIKGNADDALVRVISDALNAFYNALLKKIETIDLKDVLKHKNPYLYRAKDMKTAEDIVDAILAAYVSSSEETIFGNEFFEPIVIALSGGVKAQATGIDVMIEDRENNTVKAIAVKSGTNVFNADSKKRQNENFMEGASRARQAKMAYDAVIGYCYGRKSQKKSKNAKPVIYRELAGQDFWHEITGDPEFYKKIIDYMGNLPEQKLKEYKSKYSQARQRMLGGFKKDFCTSDGKIDWSKTI